MSTPTNHWKLGLFVVVGVVIAFGAVVYLGAASLRHDHVNYHAYFDESVHGLEVGSPIEFRGVKVGEVSAIGVAPDGRHVAVTCALFTTSLHELGLTDGVDGRTRMAIPPGLRIQIVILGITGRKGLLIDFFDGNSPVPELPFPVADTTIPVATSTLKNLETSVGTAVDQVPEVATAVILMVERADRVLAELERAELGAAGTRTLGRADRAIAALQRAINDAGLAEISAHAQRDLAHLDQTLGRIDATLVSTQRATDAIGDLATSSPRLGEDLEATLREMREAAASFRHLVDALERDPDMLLKGRGAGL